MTEAREWTEELVAQYYEIQGYLVLRDVPTTTGKGGGRVDADVLTFKIDKNIPVLRHVEVGTYYESASTIAEKLRKKFGKGHVEWKLWSLTHNLRNLHPARIA